MARWQVTYVLAPPVEVVQPIGGYPSRKISFSYDPTGKLAAVAHVITLPASSVAFEVESVSMARLRFLWDALAFRRGAPLPVASRRVERLLSKGAAIGGTHCTATTTATGLVIAPIRFPASVPRSPKTTSLGGYLSFAMAARDADDAQAIRDYVKILEGLLGKRSLKQRHPGCRHVRDFVSHAQVDHSDVLSFLQLELGVPRVDRFDPNDAAHRALVRKYRDEARKLAEAKLEKMLKQAP